MLSFWEKESFVEYDCIVVGSGIVGLSTALSIKEKRPDASVLVLERGMFPTGASTKNAGFACFGSLTELINDINTLGEDGMLDLVALRWEGLEKLRSRLTNEALDYHDHGGYELIREQEMPYLQHMERVNELLKDRFKHPVFKMTNEKIRDFGFNKSAVQAMIYNRYEGQIDTGKMMKNLIEIAYKQGITILTGCQVKAFHDQSGQVDVQVESPLSPTPIHLRAGKVALCTNAFTKDLLPDLNLSPGRGIVLVTKPLDMLPFRGVFHIDQGYYYFRNFGKRVIFGGGRNLDIEGETTTSFEINEQIQAELLRQLKENILPGTDFEIEHTWAGIMAFGPDKAPIIQTHSENVMLGVRLGGMGVAIGSIMGEKLAERML